MKIVERQIMLSFKDMEDKKGRLIMMGKNLAEGYVQAENRTIKRQKEDRVIQTISLIALPILWVGYFYSIYRANETNVSSYMFGIMMFSLINSDVLFKGEKTQYKALDILAKIEGILLVIWGLGSVFSVLFI